MKMRMVHATGCPRVEEYLHGGTEEAWKTVYYYNVRNSAQTREDVSAPFHMDMNDDWKYGHLQKKEEYRYRNSQYVLAGSTEYKYQLQMMKASPTLKAFYRMVLEPDISYYINNENDIRQALSWRRWLRWGGKPLIWEETGKEYFENGDIITTTKKYEYAISPAYDNHHLHPLRITTSGSSANITEQFVYPEDVENAGITENLGQRSLIDRNEFNKLLLYSRTENNVTQTTRQVFSSSYLPESVKNQYGQQHIRGSYPLPQLRQIRQPHLHFVRKRA